MESHGLALIAICGGRNNQFRTEVILFMLANLHKIIYSVVCDNLLSE